MSLNRVIWKVWEVTCPKHETDKCWIAGEEKIRLILNHWSIERYDSNLPSCSWLIPQHRTDARSYGSRPFYVSANSPRCQSFPRTCLDRHSPWRCRRQRYLAYPRGRRHPHRSTGSPAQRSPQRPSFLCLRCDRAAPAPLSSGIHWSRYLCSAGPRVPSSAECRRTEPIAMFQEVICRAVCALYVSVAQFYTLCNWNKM